jgi:cytochrome c biogenesis protein CcmG/thiol:disulfide interchange protein DsbE
MRKRTWVLIALLILVAISFLVIRTININKFKEATKPVFVPAPDFVLLDIKGGEKKLSDFKGKVVILDFWTTWCPPCKAEIPHFIELYDTYRERGLEIIGISLDWNVERVVPPFAEENGINYMLLAGNEKVTELYGGIMSIPTTFVIDRNGNIRKRYIGYRDKEVFERDVKELL